MSPNSSANLQEVEQRYDELEKRSTDEHEVAAHEESELHGREHATTTTAATTNDSVKILEQHTMTTAAAAAKRNRRFLSGSTRGQRRQQLKVRKKFLSSTR